MSQQQPTKSKWAILITVLIMTFMVCLDSSIVTVALPVMQKRLGAGDEIQWVSSVYLIATCVVLLPFGRLGDRFGKVFIFQAGVVGFTIGSLLCGIAQTLPVLIAARIVQGVGCALAMANNMGIITEAFPAHERGRAMGLLSSFVALGMMVGPVLGGVIVSRWPWEWIFLINVPVGIASYFVGRAVLPRSERQKEPLEKTSLLDAIRLCFEREAFRLNFATMFIVFMGIGASELLLPFYFQDAHGFGPDMAGLLFLALPVANALIGPLSGAISDRIGCEVPTLVGLVVYIVGLLAVGTLDDSSSIPTILLLVGLMSTGTAIFQSPNNALFMNSAPPRALGVAGSMGGLARYLGLAIGIWGGSELLYGRMSAEMGTPVTSLIPGRPDIFLAGFTFVFHVLAILISLACVLTALRWFRKRQERAGRKRQAEAA
ncbi:MFS transporter [Collinsella sp. AGMB00827]|uniref:MFS transporter n=1 Tax=Collinsella ureilytica TaxID=2869515 RepID=A0ABS7MHZ9_9ACTN|nr:MFS transporter [Collinsella urealyticum]MBY4796933.1 MFS transporter [Collinsella urealyticum]